MRQITLAMLVLFGVTAFCAAQARELSFRQFGMATQEMQDIGSSAAHSTLPIGSRARVLNEANGRDAEVTIIRRIPPSSARIIDLSPAAAAALGIASGGPVVVETQDLSLMPNQPPAEGRQGAVSRGGPYDAGRIRLMLHENTGRFSLYFLEDRDEPRPFFMTMDPRTSFLAVQVNNRAYRLGEAPAFRTRFDDTPENPGLVFDSSFLSVSERFSFIKTGSSSLENGVRITITITNKTEQPVEAGLRFLIDTTLGEAGEVHFGTDQRQISNETIIDVLSTDRYWASQNNRLALVGILAGQNATKPDFVHFANWKQLYDAAWNAPHVPGRHFNLLPYSIGDSAVCYYFEPKIVAPGGTRTIIIVLASEDESGVVRSVPVTQSRPGQSSGVQSITLDNKMTQLVQEDLVTLQYLLDLLDQYAISGVVTDEDLTAIETRIVRLKEKYGIP